MNNILNRVKLYFDLKKVYVLLFMTLAFWAYFAYFTLIELIGDQEKYSKLINISGKQRMLSQKTALISKRYYESKDEALKSHLSELISLMKSDHLYLINHLPSEDIKDIYFSQNFNLDYYVNEYFKLLDEYSNKNDSESLHKIENYSFNLLPKLNHAVNVFEKESTSKVKKAKDRETLILMLTLLTLLVEAFIIVFPTLNIVQKKEQELEEINKTLKARVEEEVGRIREKDKMLIQQSKMASLGEIIQNIAHQWRQPLSIISTAASGTKLQKEYNSLNDEILNRNLDVIITTTKYLSNVIDDFREYFKQDDELILINLRKVHRKALKIIGEKLENLIVLENIDEVKVVGFQNEILQVLINIYTNSFDILANKEGKKIISVSIKELDKDSVIIEIIDNGGGVDENILNKIFEPYFSTKYNSMGTGLGLFMVREIITKNFKSKIEVSNDKLVYKKKEYLGAKFTIILNKNLKV